MTMEAKTNGNGSTALATQAAAATVELDTRSGEIVRVGFDTLQGFVALQRIGAAFAASTLVPEAYVRNVANCIIAIEMAARMRASPLMVMQNLYLVKGRPAWSAQFAIASFNDCGRFTAIKYRWTGEKGKDSWGCIAWAKEKETGEIVEGPEVNVAMAKGEGWWSKKDSKGNEISKWQTMPQLMLTYRAAAFLIRTTAPELLMGLRTVDEQEDIGPAGDDLPSSVPDAPRGTAGLKAALQAQAPVTEPAAQPPSSTPEVPASPGPAPAPPTPPQVVAAPAPGEEVKPEAVKQEAVFVCEASAEGDPPCMGGVTFDGVTRGRFCPLHQAVSESIRREWHKKNGARNRGEGRV